MLGQKLHASASSLHWDKQNYSEGAKVSRSDSNMFSIRNLHTGGDTKTYKTLDEFLRFGDIDDVISYVRSPNCILAEPDKQLIIGSSEEYDRLVRHLLASRFLNDATNFGHAMCFVCIGSEYAHRLLEFSLPTLVFSKPESYFQGSANWKFVFCVDGEAESLLAQCEVFSNYLRTGLFSMFRFSEDLCALASLARLRAKSAWTWQMTYLANVGHYGFIESCRRLGVPAVLGWPDWIYEKDFCARTTADLSYGDVVCVPSYRVKESLSRDALNALTVEEGAVVVDYSRMVQLVINSLGEFHWANNSRLITNPPRLLWRIDDESFCSSILNLAPYAFKLDKVSRPVKLSLDPVDGNFCSKFWIDRDFHVSESISVDLIVDSAFDIDRFSVPFTKDLFFSFFLRQLNSFTLHSFSHFLVHSSSGRKIETRHKSELAPQFEKFLLDFWAGATPRLWTSNC